MEVSIFLNHMTSHHDDNVANISKEMTLDATAFQMMEYDFSTATMKSHHRKPTTAQQSWIGSGDEVLGYGSCLIQK
jgi:hypothetical protein